MEEEGVDRISGLPEGILHHVLSFLLTKDAIQTSATCKTLNQVWTNHPYLDLGDNFFPILPRKKDNGIQNIGEVEHQGDQDIEEVGHEGDQNIEEEVGHQGHQNIEDEEVRHQGDQNIEDEEVGQQGDQNVVEEVGQQGNQNVVEEIGHQGNQNIEEEVGQQGDQNVEDEEVGQQGDQNVEEVGHQGDQNVEEVGHQGDQNNNDEDDGNGDEDEDEDEEEEEEEEEEEDEDSSIEDDKEDMEIILRKREKLLTFVEQTLARMRMQGITIQKFRLGRTELDVELRQYLDRWIESLVHSNINELVLHISSFREYKLYDLPPILLTASSLRALTLTCCRIPCGSTFWPSLRKLNLEDVYFDEKFLSDIFKTCCDLEELQFNGCHGLEKRIRVPEESQLRVLRIQILEEVDEVVVGAQYLEKLTYNAGVRPTRINIITNFKGNLKYLHLCGANITNAWFCELISRLPRLEELRLTQLNLKAIEISSSSLKRFTLTNVFHYKDNTTGELSIDAPNLVQLNYFGCLSNVFHNSLAAKKVLLVITDLWSSKCTDEQVCNKLMQFLHKFDSSDDVTLDCTLFEHMILPVETRLNLLAPLARIKSFMLRGIFRRSPVDVLPDLLKTLLWIAPNLVNLSLREKQSNKEYPVDLTKFTSEVTAAGCDGSSLKKYELKDAGVAAEVARISEALLQSHCPNPRRKGKSR